MANCGKSTNQEIEDKSFRALTAIAIIGLITLLVAGFVNQFFAKSIVQPIISIGQEMEKKLRMAILLFRRILKLKMKSEYLQTTLIA